MRHLVLARRVGVPVVAALGAALVVTPAFADVTVSPTAAVQGGGEDFTFHVANTGAQPIGTVTLTMPDDSPVAEVYPLSVDDWAPKITMKTLTTPLPSLHDGIPTTEVTGSITWIAMPGRALAPGAATDLRIAIGPLPTLSTMRFTLATAYTDGRPGPAMSPAVVALSPAPPGQAAAGHASHVAAGDGTASDGTAGDGTAGDQVGGDQVGGADPADPDFAQVVADATRGPSIASIGGWVLAGLVLLAGLGWVLRARHRAAGEGSAEDGATDEGPAEDGATDEGPTDEGPTHDGRTDEEDGSEPSVEEPTAEEGTEPVPVGKWSFKG